MEFNAESIAAEVEKQFAGVTITDGPNGPIVIKAAVRLSTERRKLINSLSAKLERQARTPKIEVDGEKIDDPNWEPDFDVIDEIQLQALTLRCDEPKELREWLADKDPAARRILQDALNKADQGEAEAQ